MHKVTSRAAESANLKEVKEHLHILLPEVKHKSLNFSKARIAHRWTEMYQQEKMYHPPVPDNTPPDHPDWIKNLIPYTFSPYPKLGPDIRTAWDAIFGKPEGQSGDRAEKKSAQEKKRKLGEGAFQYARSTSEQRPSPGPGTTKPTSVSAAVPRLSPPPSTLASAATHPPAAASSPVLVEGKYMVAQDHAEKLELLMQHEAEREAMFGPQLAGDPDAFWEQVDRRTAAMARGEEELEPVVNKSAVNKPKSGHTRRPPKCSKCGQLKKGHKCTFKGT